ncbi:uncharacterized protein C1orf105 homolog isoform X3 [Sturnira hondurensis]|uniref:uncharacterized protein C1orf105 homolog isoform X3 n=1 Tax=Sturnira hondurensis TaxID=192404 RepID=UPI00187A022A|nr:uncharacterized protein C1orf105 homolog isoform X3 [Sturnira hondurensis]
MEDSKESTVSVPKFDKVPWLSDASLRNKPLLLSLPKRYPHTSATFLISYKKDTNLPSLFQVPDDSFQARRKPNDPALVRNRQLCASCWEMRMARPRTTQDSGDQTLSFEAFMSRKMKCLQPPKAQTVAKSPQDDVSTESFRHRLPIVGPRTAVFCGLLSPPLGTLPLAQLSPTPRGKPKGKTVWQ